LLVIAKYYTRYQRFLYLSYFVIARAVMDTSEVASTKKRKLSKKLSERRTESETDGYVYALPL